MFFPVSHNFGTIPNSCSINMITFIVHPKQTVVIPLHFTCLHNESVHYVQNIAHLIPKQGSEQNFIHPASTTCKSWEVYCVTVLVQLSIICVFFPRCALYRDPICKPGQLFSLFLIRIYINRKPNHALKGNPMERHAF